MTQYAVNLHDVSVQRGEVEVLHAVTLSLAVGKIIGFIGPSGAGKTTLIRAIVGRQKPTTGKLTVLGMPAGNAALRTQVSYMTQNSSIYSDLTVRQNVAYFATMFGIKRAARKSTVAEILQTVALTDQADQMVTTLSGGERQRVSLAAALIGNPTLMVLDEPTVGLDPVLREQLWKLFRLLAEQGTTVIISSHVMDEAERCDSLVLLRNGSVIAKGSPEQLCTQTNTTTVEQSFLQLVGAAS